MHNLKSRPIKCRFLYVLGGILLGLFGFSAMAQPAKPIAERPQVIVQFKPGNDDAKAKEIVEKHGGKVKKHIHWQGRAEGKGPLVVVEAAEPVEQAVEKFKNEPNVEFAEPDWIQRHQTVAEETVVSPESVANDTYYTAGYLWGLMDTGANSFGTRASAAWAAGYTGAKSVYVGVID